MVLLGSVGLALAAYGCARHVPPLLLGDGRAADIPGAVLGLVGIGLVAIAIRDALAGATRRVKLLAIPAALVLAQFYVLPVVTAGLAVNADRFDVEPARALGMAGARDVEFAAADGVELAGWYVPGRRGATVVLAHGSHGSREAVEDHLRLLHRLGYGVLAFDARGHGESDGEPNALGWRGAEDLRGAVRYLKTQVGVAPSQIALFGVSMGGEEALRAASEGVDAAAVIADGAGASTTGDAQAGGQGGLELAVGWLSMRATELLAGDREPAPLVNTARDNRVPALLIASDAKDELAINRRLAVRTAGLAKVWHASGVGHTEALERRPAEYARRVNAFLDASP